MALKLIFIGEWPSGYRIGGRRDAARDGAAAGGAVLSDEERWFPKARLRRRRAARSMVGETERSHTSIRRIRGAFDLRPYWHVRFTPTSGRTPVRQPTRKQSWRGAYR